VTAIDPASSKPLPEPSALAQPFWAALRNGQLQLQRCTGCGHFNHPPRITCPKCHGKSLVWTEVAPRGTVYSYTIVHRAPMPCFKADVPYAVALVDIEGTPARLLSNLSGPLDQVRVGMPVDVVFERASDEITLFKFAPAARSQENPHAQH
jgi:uncharacterized OB-fold protein